MAGGLSAEEKALIAGAYSGHSELQPGMATAHDDGVLNAHPAPTATPTMNPIESNADLRDKLLGKGKVTGSQGVE